MVCGVDGGTADFFMRIHGETALTQYFSPAQDAAEQHPILCTAASHTMHGGIPNYAWRHPKRRILPSETAQRLNDGKPRRRQSKTVLED